MPSIGFWPGVAGGTEWYRCRTPAGALSRKGWDVVYVEDGSASLDVDVLVLQRLVGDWVPEMVRRIRQVRPRMLLVYDIDDWYDEIPSYNKASKRIGPAELASMHTVMRSVDLITVSTPALAEGYGRLNWCEVLPNYLDPDVFADVDRYRGSHDGIWIGWLNAFEWRGGDAELLKAWLGRFLEDYPEFTFVSCGGPEVIRYLEVAGLTTPEVEGRTGYLRPYDHLPAMLAPLDIGLAPVTYNRFNECKSWCKAMEYNACGVPVVCSPSREYRAYLQPGVNGLFARKDWAGAVLRVAADLDRYRQNARAFAERYFIDDHIGKWVSAFQSAATAAA